MDVRTAWLKPPSKAGGQDHLGIQQLPTRIFSTLLPGLTVVTDRVSNYSFYPWVVWAHLQDQEQLGLDFVHTLRRAECLLTLIAERHAHLRHEDELLHSRGLVGRNTLVPALHDDAPRPIPLGELAALRSENSNSYFKNRYGGLGQYYLGSLRELGILDRVSERIECSEDIGVPLARALDAQVDRKAFLHVLKHGWAGEKDLDGLASFCPCHLSRHTPERELLIDLLFARNVEPTPADARRRQTLLLLLDLALRRGSVGETALDIAFRAACLTGATDDGSPWAFPEKWRRVQRACATYEQNDELSIGVLGIFWVALRLLDERDGRAESANDVGALVSEVASAALQDQAGLRLDDAIAQKVRSLPPLPNWQDANHEFQRSQAVSSSARETDVTGCLIAALDTLLAIAARHAEEQPYLEVGIPSSYLNDYPLNLSSFHQKVSGEWCALTLSQWVGILAAEWGIEAHLRVALRKLHHESLDTFLLYATDEGICRRQDAAAPLPGFTASRLSRAVQFLIDLGLASWEPPNDAATSDPEGHEYSGVWAARISTLGRDVWETFRG